MKSAALLVAVVTIIVGLVGLVSPDSVTAIRRQYFATSAGLYAAGAVRVAMGLVLILAAPVSGAPRTLRVLGAAMCLQGLSAALLGLDRAQAVLEWETTQTVLLRVGAAVALAAGGVVAFAVIAGRHSGAATA